MVQIDLGVLEAAISLISSLVWPLVVVYFLIRFEDEIRKLLNRIQSVKGGGVEIDLRPSVEAAARMGLAKPGEEQANPEVRIREIVAETVQAARPDIADRLSQARLLWVDDMPQNNRLERRALETFGVEIETSTSTSDA